MVPKKFGFGSRQRSQFLWSILSRHPFEATTADAVLLGLFQHLNVLEMDLAILVPVNL